MKNKITRRYLAGLLDGEGYFGIRPDFCHSRAHYKPVIKMGLAEKSAYLVVEIKNLLGGHIWINKRKTEVNASILYQWEVHTFEAVRKVIDYVRPYLILKKQQADLINELIKTKMSHENGTFYRVPSHILKKRYHLYTLIRELNKRGRALAETKCKPPVFQDEVIVRPSEKSEEVIRNDNSASRLELVAC